ncbi:MAG: hypothetical protein WBA09_22600, partial [Candidatus Acidiferrum sp.]
MLEKIGSCLLSVCSLFAMRESRRREMGACTAERVAEVREVKELERPREGAWGEGVHGDFDAECSESGEAGAERERQGQLKEEEWIGGGIARRNIGNG